MASGFVGELRFFFPGFNAAASELPAAAEVAARLGTRHKSLMVSADDVAVGRLPPRSLRRIWTGVGRPSARFQYAVLDHRKGAGRKLARAFDQRPGRNDLFVLL